MSAVIKQDNSYTGLLTTKSTNLRFRGIGNPYAFLDEIGIVPLKEYIYRGATILDLAETLNLPVTTIRTWVEQKGLESEFDEASTLSAEGYIRQGETLLKTATNKFELDKAKAMIEHGRWMASKKDKRTYGTQPGELGAPAGVTYIFQVGESANIQVNHKAPDPKDPKNFKDNTTQKQLVELKLDENGLDLRRPPDYLQTTASPFEAIAPVVALDEDEILDISPEDFVEKP